MFTGVARCVELALLLAMVVSGVQVPDLSLTLTNERTTIERTYELTKYLEHQLKDIKDTYLSYLGPPFSDPDFSPPRPNSSSLSVPSAATRVELWRGLENGARLAQNQRAYRVLLCAMRELARSTLCPYLQSSLLHFCSGLNGLLGSITGLMGSLGYVSPPQLADGTVLLPSGGGVGGGSLLLAEHRASARAVAPGQHSPAPIRAQQQTQRHHGDHSRQRARDEQRHGGGAAVATTGGGAKEEPVRRRGERGERGRRARRREEEAATTAWEVEEMDEETAREGGMERWGRRRRLLSVDELELEEASIIQLYNINNNNNNNNDNNNKYTVSTQTQVGERDMMDEQAERQKQQQKRESRDTTALLYVSSSSSSSSQPHRSPRSLSSLYSGTLPPSLSLLLQYGPGGAAGVGPRTGTSAAGGVPPDGAHSLLAAPLLSAHPVSSEFSRKVEGFWVLRELQSWLWRSAKDFNRLKKRLKA